MSWFLAFAGFAVLIILHELGHFVVAKAVGMRVERFALFFPWLILKKKIGETEYGIGTIPLGGYVKITGMSPDEDIPPEVAHRAYYKQPVWKRISVIAAGPIVNIVVAFIIFVGYFTFIGAPNGKYEVGTIVKDTPAAHILQQGDQIVAVDGRKGNTDQLSKRIQQHKCAGTATANCVAKESVALTVNRDGKLLNLSASPYYDAKAKRMRLGFAYKPILAPLSISASAGRSVDQMWAFTSGTITRLATLWDEKARKDLSGPVGSYEATRQGFLSDIPSAIFILGIISLSLGIINLLPFLPLDGGHIFWALAEKLRGRAISFRVLERASFVGFALVLMLFFIGLSNDIGRLTGPGT